MSKESSYEASKVGNTQANTSNRKSVICKFCKKIGHTESTYSVKERSEIRHTCRVNLCGELPAENSSPRFDLVPAVVQGVLLDVLIVSTYYPLPLIEDRIDRLGHFKHFTCLDMSTGFHQIPVDEEFIHKTAFVTPEGHWKYLRMPYGLSNSPVEYQRIINDTLRSHINAGNVLVYVDDVLIMSDTKYEGINTRTGPYDFN